MTTAMVFSRAKQMNESIKFHSRAAVILILIWPMVAWVQSISAQRSGEDFMLPVQRQRNLPIEDSVKPRMEDLINVFKELTKSQAIDLGPLTDAERFALTAPASGPHSRRERIGIVREVSPTLKVSGLTKARARSMATNDRARVDVSADGQLTWTTRITSRGATSIRVQLREVDLPPGSKIYITDGQTEVWGPYDPTEDILWTHSVFADTIFLQVQLTAATLVRDKTSRYLRQNPEVI